MFSFIGSSRCTGEAHQRAPRRGTRVLRGISEILLPDVDAIIKSGYVKYRWPPQEPRDAFSKRHADQTYFPMTVPVHYFKSLLMSSKTTCFVPSHQNESRTLQSPFGALDCQPISSTFFLQMHGAMHGTVHNRPSQVDFTRKHRAARLVYRSPPRSVAVFGPLGGTASGQDGSRYLQLLPTKMRNEDFSGMDAVVGPSWMPGHERTAAAGRPWTAEGSACFSSGLGWKQKELVQEESTSRI